MARIHHATAARAAKLGFTLVEIKGSHQIACYLGAEMLAKADDAKAALEMGVEEAKKPRRQGSIVKHGYKAVYGAEAHCGDPMALALKEATEYVRDGKLACDLAKLYAIAVSNGIDMAKYEGLNPGQQRMNVGNRLRGLIRRGERDVVIDGQIFPKATVAE